MCAYARAGLRFQILRNMFIVRPKRFNGVGRRQTRLAIRGGHDKADSCGLLRVSLIQFCGDRAFVCRRAFASLSVPGAHAVVDEDVEGEADVGVDLQEPVEREERVLVAASRVQLRHEGQHQPASCTQPRRVTGMC